jgi:hypothetical protein
MLEKLRSKARWLFEGETAALKPPLESFVEGYTDRSGSASYAIENRSAARDDRARPAHRRRP